MATIFTPPRSSNGPIDFVKPIRACLVAAYIGDGNTAEYPAIDAIIKTTPFLFLLRNALIAMRVSLMG